MLKIKIPEIEKHRNETTFRPYLQVQKYFNDISVEFVFGDTNKYDMLWIGQASFSDKKLLLNESVTTGIKYLKQFDGQDFILFDGQDSASLIGTFDVFKESSAKIMLKNTMYRNNKRYVAPSPMGRSYWVADEFDEFVNTNYSIDENHCSRLNDVYLSGANWLSTVYPTFLGIPASEKDIDVFAMFQFPARENFEFGIRTNTFYTRHRQRCIDELKKLTNLKIVTVESEGYVDRQKYYNLLKRSKIVVAPFGYGEIAPRDIESASVGATLIKPLMSHIRTIPDVYVDNETYVPVNWDYRDLTDKIEMILSCPNLPDNWKPIYHHTNLRDKFLKECTAEKLVTYIHQIISNIPGYGI